VTVVTFVHKHSTHARTYTHYIHTYRQKDLCVREAGKLEGSQACEDSQLLQLLEVRPLPGAARDYQPRETVQGRHVLHHFD
jgi:hypothetical protein